MPLTPLNNNDFLQCPICFNAFNVDRKPVTLACCHTCCSSCLKSLQSCPFDQTPINHDLPKNEVILSILTVNNPVNAINAATNPITAANLLSAFLSNIANSNNEKLINCFNLNQNDLNHYRSAVDCIQNLAQLIKPQNSSNNLLSRPMQRKLISLIHCQLVEDECRLKCVRICRSIGERITSELLLKHQDPYTLSANLWAAVRSRGCQFLGPALQEEILKLVLSALEDGSHLSRKVLVMFVVQRLSPHFPHQASKTAIGHVIQLLYRASCFRLTKRDGDSSLMQLKEEYCSYEALRREHDTQIVSIALESGLKISPDQWTSFLYGSPAYKSHMQSIIDKLQSPQSFNQSIQELIIALQRTQDPANLINLKDHLERLAKIDSLTNDNCTTISNQNGTTDEAKDDLKNDKTLQNQNLESADQPTFKDHLQKEVQYPTYEELAEILESCKVITFRLVDFLKQYNTLFSNVFRFNRNTNYGNTSKFKGKTFGNGTASNPPMKSKSPNEENKKQIENMFQNQNLINNYKSASNGNLSSNAVLNAGINTLVNTTGKLDYSTNSINSLNTTIQSIQSLNTIKKLNGINNLDGNLTNSKSLKPYAFVSPTVLQQNNLSNMSVHTAMKTTANTLFNNQTNFYTNSKVKIDNNQSKYQMSCNNLSKLNSTNLANQNAKLNNNLKLDSNIKQFSYSSHNVTNENLQNNQNIQNNQQHIKAQLPSPVLKHELLDSQSSDLSTLIQPKPKSAKKSNHNSFSFDEDQFIPFQDDQPKISRFGPISRMGLINTQTVTGLNSTVGLQRERENGKPICKNTNVVLGTLPSLIRPFNTSLFISNEPCIKK